MCVIMNQFEIW